MSSILSRTVYEKMDYRIKEILDFCFRYGYRVVITENAVTFNRRGCEMYNTFDCFPFSFSKLPLENNLKYVDFTNTEFTSVFVVWKSGQKYTYNSHHQIAGLFSYLEEM